MTRQVTDQLYIELDYFTPEEYYVYIAEAALTATSSASLSSQLGIVKEFSSTLQAEFSLTATISHIEGVDIVLAPFATVSASADVIKSGSSSINSEFTTSISGDRIRLFDSSLSATATVTASVDVIPGGAVEEASASLSSEFTISISANRSAGLAASMAAEFTQTTQAETVFNVSSTQTVASAFTADAVANRSAEITLETIGNLNAQADRFTDTLIVISSALSASLTANALKNHTAILESSFAFTADAIIVSEATASLALAFTQTTSVERSAGLSSTQSASAQLSAIVGNVKEFTATFNSSVSLSASGDRATRTAVEFELRNDGQLTTADKKFGSGSITSTSSANNIIIGRIKNNHGIQLKDQEFTIDFWRKVPDGTLIQVQGKRTNNTTVNTLTLSIGSGGTTINLSIVGESTTTSNQANITIPADTWFHFRIVGQDFGSGGLWRYTLWVDGTRYVTFGAAPLVDTTTSFINIYGKQFSYVDELTIKDYAVTDYTVTSFTPPSQAWTNASDVQALFHYDGNLLDDNITTVRSGNASISSSASVTAVGSLLRSTASSMAVAASMTTAADRIRDNSSSMSAAGFVMTTAGYLIDDLADLNAVTTLTVNAVKTVSAVSTQTSTATVTALGGYVKDFASQPFVEFHVDADVNTIPNITATVTATASLTADVQRLRGITADLQAEGFTVTIAGEQQNVTATLTSTATLTAQLDIVKEFATTATGTATLTILAGVLTTDSAALSSSFAQTAQGDRIRLSAVSMSAESTQTTQAVAVLDIASAITSQAQISTTVSRTRDHIVPLVAESLSTVTAAKTTENITSAQAQSTQATGGNYIASATVNGQAVGFVIAITAYTSDTNADLHSETTLTASATVTGSAQSTLASTVAVTAQPTRIIQYIGNAITGVRSQDLATDYWTEDENPNIDFGNNTVFSFWAKKDTLQTRAAFIGSDPSVVQFGNATRIEHLGTTFRIAKISPSLNSYATWTNSVPNDTDWHHYLLQVGPAIFNIGGGSDPYRTVTLWRDGVSYGSRNFNFFAGFSFITTILFGQGAIPGVESITPGPLPFNGSLAQVWEGTITPQAFNISDFYHGGAVDLGPDGTSYGLLPTPNYYNSLDTPYQGLTFHPNIAESNFYSTELLPVPDMTAQADMSAFAQTVQVISAVLNTDSSLTAQSQVNYSESVDISSSTALSASTQVTKPYSSSMLASAAITVVTGNLLSAQAELASTSTQSTNADVIRGSQANLSSNFTQVSVTGVLGSGVANLTTTATVTATADRVKDVFIAVGSNMSVSAGANYTVSAIITQASTAAVNCSAERIRGPRADLISDFGQQSIVRKITNVQSTQTATTALTVQARKLVGITANFTAFYSQLTVGDVIQLDPYLTYTIEPESRFYTVNRETRLYTVEAETREYIIQGYEL